MRTGGVVTRPSRSRFLALAGGVIAAIVGTVPAAAAAPGLTAGSGRAAAQTAHVSILITSVSPTIARPGGKVVVSGTVINPAASALAGPLSVQLWSSSTPLTSETAMTRYLATQGGTGVDVQIAGAMVSLPSVGAHASRTWSVTLPVSQVGMRAFGAYPLAAQLDQNGVQLAAARTFLPLWPGARHAGVKRLSIAWIWPLISTPHQAACGSLFSDDLATSLAPGGRLGRLLTAGLSAAGQQAKLTWAIDPALLADAATMTSPYRVGPANCSGGTPRPADAAAKTWLDRVTTIAARQDFFVTPYDDADVAALAHRGLEQELKAAFASARVEARRMLGQSQRTAAGAGPGPAASGGIAWPPDGVADYGVIESLAANQIGTIILDSAMMPPVSPGSVAPAVTTTPDGLASQVRVLLADHTLTQDVLSLPAGEIPGTVPAVGSGPAAAGAAPGTPVTSGQAASFAQEQWFLALTAVRAAQAPAGADALVVAPPRRWNPSATLAGALLRETTTTPWLRPAGLASLPPPHAGTGKVALQQPPQHRVSRWELKPFLLRQVKHLAGLLSLQESILTPAQPAYQSAALAAVESSAWRGSRASQRRARDLVRQVEASVSRQLGKVTLIEPPRVTLGGKSGAIPVTIRNGLHQPVVVGLRVSVPSTGRVTIRSASVPRVVKVTGGTQRTVKIPVKAAAAGSTTLSVRLTTPDGKPLPGPPTTLTVEATHFGTLAIEIIGVAMLVFVVTAAVRAVRRGRGAGPGRGPAGAEEESDPAGYPGNPARGTNLTDTVGSERADDAHPSKEPDDHASTPGRPSRPSPR